ncbi:MAG: hypothetical protein IJ560_00330 [Alphaproteobacteria bacterium]|nr:hypothetical protein [Alphaproteobacteria bacterium]
MADFWGFVKTICAPKKRWFFGAWGVVCGIGAANAELPENVKFCIPKQYTITYDCGQLGGTVPDSVRIGYGHNFTTADTSACGGMAAGWRVNDSDTIITPNTTLPYTYVNDITLSPVVNPFTVGVDFAINGTTYYSINSDGTENGTNKHDINIQPTQWYVNFTYGNVIGNSACTTKYNSENVFDIAIDQDISHISDGSGQYCYCSILSIADMPNITPKWIYRVNFATASSEGTQNQCTSRCALNCAWYTRDNFVNSVMSRSKIFSGNGIKNITD